MDGVIDGRYAVLTSPGKDPAPIGKGAFGVVYKGVDNVTKKLVAIKVESLDAEHPQLIYEARVLQELRAAQGIPAFYHFGDFGATANALVMQLLGPPVASARLHTILPLPRQHTCHIALGALAALRTIHNAGFVHRDLKPENLLWGKPPPRETPLPSVYVIDFGLCKRVLHADGSHIPERTDKPLIGTPQYAAIRAHFGGELSRRDDVESLAYVLAYLAKGSLPWQGCSTTDDTDSRYTRMGTVKRTTSHASLLAGVHGGVATAIMFMLTHAQRQVHFHGIPNHDVLMHYWRKAAN